MLVTLMETTAEIILRTRQQELIQDLTKNRPRHTVIRQTTPIRSLSKAGSTDHRPSIFRRQRRHSGLDGSSLNNLLKPGSLITYNKKLTL